MATQPNLYDELPYKSYPIEWTAPERLALASLLHSGPRAPLEGYRVLELGCGDGANLLPLAYFRRHAAFVGVDGSRASLAVAETRRSELGLSNVEFIDSDFLRAEKRLSGDFDYILAHGVFSWVSHEAREALWDIFRRRLRPGGLLYLNYNTRPGWNVRGLVREYLLERTAGMAGLRSRAQLAQEVCAQVVASLGENEHPYTRLLADEFRFVCESHVSYVAHEFLAPDNHAYWRSEFLAMASRHGLAHVADADFNYASGRVPEGLAPRLELERLVGRTLEDTVDLLCYRQLHSPILSQAPPTRCVPNSQEWGQLVVASCLAPCPRNGTANPMFQHPSGYQVEAKEEMIRVALDRLCLLWPRGLRAEKIFPDVTAAVDDLKLLQRNGLIELRCIEPGDSGIAPDALHRLEAREGYVTTPYHTREAVPSAFEVPAIGADETSLLPRSTSAAGGVGWNGSLARIAVRPPATREAVTAEPEQARCGLR